MAVQSRLPICERTPDDNVRADSETDKRNVNKSLGKPGLFQLMNWKFMG